MSKVEKLSAFIDRLFYHILKPRQSEAERLDAKAGKEEKQTEKLEALLGAKRRLAKVKATNEQLRKEIEKAESYVCADEEEEPKKNRLRW